MTDLKELRAKAEARMTLFDSMTVLELIDRIEKAEADVRAVMIESDTNLRMYVRAYKMQPWETGITLELYVRDYDQRMAPIRREYFKEGAK